MYVCPVGCSLSLCLDPVPQQQQQMGQMRWTATAVVCLVVGLAVCHWRRRRRRTSVNNMLQCKNAAAAVVANALNFVAPPKEWQSLILSFSSLRCLVFFIYLLYTDCAQWYRDCMGVALLLSIRRECRVVHKVHQRPGQYPPWLQQP